MIPSTVERVPQHTAEHVNERIRRETQAVLDVLRRIIEGSDTLVWSWVLSFENDKHPRSDRRDEIAVWEPRSER